MDENPEETPETEETVPPEETPAEPTETEPAETPDTELISYSGSEDLQAADLFGEAALNEDIAFTVLQENLGLDDAEAGELTASLFALGDSPEVPEYPSRSDDTEINRINVHWITPDTEDNGDESLLYIRPSGDNPFNVRLQIDYALSGEHNYEPGDITITIPASVIHRREGGDAGITLLPYPEDPSKKNDFNWKLVNGNYIITNTKRMSAATKGFIQIAFDELIPHELVDMQESDPFEAYIQVVTWKGNTIAKRSEAITAQFDTEARVTDAGKRAVSAPVRVPASRIPEAQRVEGETEYILVDWYVWGTTVSNTKYTLDLIDTMPQEYDGFIVGADTEDGLHLEKDSVYQGYAEGMTRYYNFTTAYPASQFVKDTEYTFHNNIEVRVTEVDPEHGDDPQLVTTATAQGTTVFSFTDPKWYNPNGHFMVIKDGNDDTDKFNRTHHKYYGTRSDSHMWSGYGSGWYGIYPTALNDLQKEYKEHGTDGGVRLSYTIDSVGYVMPWMFDQTSFERDAELASRICSNYNRPVTMTTEDSGLSFGRNGEKLVVGTDYDFVELEIPDTVWLYTGTPQNINPDGSWVALDAGDGTFRYTRDSNKSHNPDILVEYLKDGTWQELATVSWPGGQYTVTLADGSTQTSHVIALPEGTENYRTTVTLQNQNEDKTLQAAIDYDVRVVVELHSTEAMMAMTDAAFAKTNLPEFEVWNNTTMTALRTDTEETIVVIPNDGYDVIRGYTTDTAVYPSKSSVQSMQEYDQENRRSVVHYTAKVEERSVISDRATYDQAIADEAIDVQTHGFWRDLLPKGMTPDLDTITVRDGDTILDRYTIENYKGSGRTMLVVEVDLTPSPVRYRSGDMYYFEDVPTIRFDAYYDNEALTDYGSHVHNVIAFESTNEIMGTVSGYTSEADNTGTNNNVSTPNAFENDEEKSLMNDLNPNQDNPTVYAGTYTTVDVLGAARTSLSKDVQVNNDGRWSDGLYYEDPEENRRDVYEGGQYSYRLRMMSDPDTISKDLIMYDSLENFVPADGNDEIDIGAPRWQGTFRSIDVSQLIDKGCAPKVYYSTVSGLKLSSDEDPDAAHPDNTDLTKTSVWILAEEYTGDPADVKAIAVDASKKADGSDFALNPTESVTVEVRMQAPSGEEAAQYIEQNAHAYNNAYLMGTSIDAQEGSESHSFIRKDYTKVGLMEYNYPVEKRWDDDENRDNIRPAEIIVRLLADGKDTGRTITITAEGDWKGVFEHIAYTDESGNKIHYTVREEAVEGYTPTVQTKPDTTIITNTHEPEKTSVSGVKTWVNDNEELRPETIRVELYGNGTFIKDQVIKADAQGNWTYTFDNIFKYDHGEEIEYTVKEAVVTTGKAASYSSEVDGLNIINTYHPKGDLNVTKTVLDTTEVSSDQEFTFTFTFAKHVVVDIPVFDAFDYDVLDENCEVLQSGTISSNGTISIKGGQTIHVKEIDEYINYTVTEEHADGFTLTSSGGTSGTIRPNAAVTASFTNTYSAKGQINIPAEKILNNVEMKRYQFRFELYEITTDEEGNETETLIRTASNDAPETMEEREDGTVEYSAATATFSVLRYTEKDHGRTYHYRIKEVNLEKPGYTYDDAVVDVDVTVIDNGDGTMTVTPAYTKNGAAEETAQFENTYEAEGEYVLRAWKDLQGRKLTDDEFTFELLDEEGNVLQTKTNTADGSIVFDALKYDQNDIGKTYIYAVREVKGSDATVNYDEHVFGYTVEVLDNGDGTLSFTQGFAEPVTGESDCETCNGSGKLEPVELENIPWNAMWNSTTSRYDKYGPDGYPSVSILTRLFEIGELDLADPQPGMGFIGVIYYPPNTQSYKFALRGDFTGEDEQLESVWSMIVATHPDYSGVEISGPAHYYFVGGVGFAHGGYGGSLTLGYEGQCPECHGTGKTQGIIGWNTEDGELPVFINTLKDGSLSVTKKVQNAENADPNQTFRFKVKLIGDNIPDGEMEYTLEQFGSSNSDQGVDNSEDPSANEADEIPAEMFDQQEAADSLEEAENDDNTVAGNHWLSPFVLDVYAEGEDIATGTSGECTWIIDSDGVLTIRPTNGERGMLSTKQWDYYDGPWYSYRSQIKKVVVEPGVRTSAHCQHMFAYLDQCTEMDLRNLDTSAATNMYQMFISCSKLQSLDLGDFNTSKVDNMKYMFSGCSGLQSLNVSSFDTSKINDMEMMFLGCSSLKLLDLSNFNTSGVGAMTRVFDNCTNLQYLNIKGFSTKYVVTMENMFRGCTSLKSIVLGENFSFKGKDITRTNAMGILPANGDGYWMREDNTFGPFTPAELRDKYESMMAGVWVCEKPMEYTIVFQAGQDTAGSMANATVKADESFELPACRFGRFGYSFDHWDDGNGHVYSDCGVIPADTYAAGTTITLTAVFIPIDTKVNIQDGEFELTLKGNEKATFGGIPAGTAYQVYEETPDGWVLVKQENISGEIIPLETANAVFTNEYRPSVTTAQFFGTKTLDGQAAEAGAYQFTLDEPDSKTGKLTILGEDGSEAEQTLPLTVSNQEGGLIQFPVILYSIEDVGTHTYTINEVDPNNNRIDYDLHTETVTVTVTDNGDGTLAAVVTYDSDGVRFVNTTRPGELRIRKTTAAPTTDANKDDEFTFKITLSNSKGLPIGDDNVIVWYTLDRYGRMTVPETNGTEETDEPDRVQTFRLNSVDRPAAGPLLGAGEEETTMIASGTKDNVDWRITSDGELIIGNGGTQTYKDVRTSTYRPGYGSFVIDRGFQEEKDPYEDEWAKDRDFSNDYPWYPYRTQIKSVRFDGTVNGNGSMASMFYGFTNCTSIDLTGFNTSAVKNMAYMFQNCSSLTSLNLSGFDTSKVLNMYAMFNGCSNLTELDLSGFDTSKVQDMAYMFGNCRQLKRLDIRNFSTARLNGNDGYGSYQSVDGYTSSGTVAGLLNNCNSLEWMYLSPGLKMTYYTSRYHTLTKCGLPSNNYEQWVKEDRSDGPYSGNNLCLNYGSARAGIWIKEIKPDYAVVRYDSNGGSMNGQNVNYVSRTDEDQSVTLPQSVYKLHYDFTGWNTKQDGSGTHYEPGQVIDTVTDLVDYGSSITLYAELIPSNMRNYRVEHWQEGGDFGWYYRKETEYLKGDYTAPVTPAVKEYEGFRMPEPQTVTIAEDDSTVVKYYYDRCRYYVAFDGNGATSGQMKTMMMSFVNPAYLRMNVFQKKGAIFTGWNTEPDGSGTAYSNGQSINKLTDVDDEIITLYAQWQEIPNEELTPSNGVIYVTCKANETIVLPGLPDGTTYTIEEVDVPNGWTLQTTDNISGTIAANQTKQETVTNKYAAEGEIVLEAHKRMEDGSLSEGQFTFELLDSSHNVIDTKANGTTDTEPYIYDDEGNTMENPYAGTAPVVFDALTFTENDIGRTYTYYIRETAGDDAKVQYDGHEETIRVRVSDGGHGNLVTDVTYDGDGALFTNRMNPTSMVIRKTTVNSPDDNEEFTFTLDLKDPEGNALSGSYQARKYLQDYEVTEQMTDVTEYSHTSNIDDEGNAHGTYDEYLSENDIVTIDGADRLHVKVWFSTESTSYDWLAIYPAGITPTEDNYNEASISGGKLGNGRSSTRPVEESYIREYDVEGDTVQFFFRSDSSVNYYGYYAVITAEALRMVESGYEDMTVSSGDTFTLKDGEYIVIEGLPNGAAYTVTEAPKENWTLTDVSGDTGTLKSGERAEAAFTNTYEKQVDMTAVIKAEKKVTGGIINTDDHFEFELQTEGGIALQTKTVDETGGKTSSVTFDPIQYTQEDIGKTFTYYIEEKEGADENIIYDRTLYKVEVSVDETGTHVVYKTIAPSEDSEDGYAEVVVEGVPVFTNQKLGEEVTVTASKAWTNTDGSTTPPEGASVTFTLLADGEETDYSVTLDGTVDEEPEEAGGYEKEAWVAEFTGMPVSRIEEAGTEVLINYTVKETGTWQDYQPDKEEVSDGGTITNKKTAADCSVVLQARKKVVGGTIEAKDDFRFMLESEDGTVLQTKMADKTGTADSLITFDEIKYDADDTGRIYTYYIREVKGSDGNVVYDTRTYKVEVTISEEGAKTVYMDEKGTVINGLPQFENKKKTTPPEEPPKPTPTPTPPATTPNTGDDARTGLYMATAGISFILMILCLLALIRDRRQEKRF